MFLRGSRDFCKILVTSQFFLQKSLEPLKSVSGNLHRMNMLITLCNKRLDSLDLKISEYEGKRKEPPGFEQDSAKKLKTKDGTT